MNAYKAELLQEISFMGEVYKKMEKRQKRRMWILGICNLILCVSLIGMGLSSGEPRGMVYVDIDDEEVPLSYVDPSLVLETEDDIRVIPDKYNTGAKGKLAKVELDDTVEGIKLKSDGTGTKNVLDFYYRNKEISGTVVIENRDFSDCPLLLYNGDKVDRSITLIFNNCKFSKLSAGRMPSNISWVFNNCTFNNFSGSDATFVRCKFGNYYLDGLNPFQNILVQDCFFGNLNVIKTSAGDEHTDGTHIYGYSDTSVYNVTYENCRFEIPAIEKTGSNAFINACFMLQLEYNSGKNITVRNSRVNGGGYSIYARTTSEEYTLENVILQNIKVGCAKKYGTFYPRVSEEIVLEDIIDTDSLYIASVWKENNETHFSVTNDTNQERELLILTDKGRFSYIIPACPRGEELPVDCSYEDLPFDLDIVVPADCNYAICYDTFFEGAAKQIRFVNWTGEKVNLTVEEREELFSGENDVWCSGMCGKEVQYTLDKMGTLTISGQGVTDNFHSQKRAPWYENREFIKQVVVEEGVTGLGAQIFTRCESLQNVVLPESLEYIESRAFDNCVALKCITWPSTLKKVGTSAFAYSFMESIWYTGSDWNEIEIDSEEREKIALLLKE